MCALFGLSQGCVLYMWPLFSLISKIFSLHGGSMKLKLTVLGIVFFSLSFNRFLITADIQYHCLNFKLSFNNASAHKRYDGDYFFRP